MKEYEPITNPIVIPVKEKYLTRRNPRGGSYAVRTGSRKRPGYVKHKFLGMNRRPYFRIKGH